MSDKIFENHMTDLARRSYDRNYAVYSDFLNMDEISILYSLKLPQRFELFGGYEEAERKIACFSDDFESAEYPIDCVKASPLNKKFSDDLSHRDFLGAVMNLGINRNSVGDIIVRDNTAYIFCLRSISDYIIDNLFRVKHTSVKCEKTNLSSLPAPKEPKEREINVSSLRADAVCGAVYNISRSKIKPLFSEKKIFINSRLCEKDSVLLKDGDVISVRGHGKFIFFKEIRKTKKNRIVIEVKIYEN